MMHDLLVAGAVLVAWYVMARWVLPRLGRAHLTGSPTAPGTGRKGATAARNGHRRRTST